MFLDYNQNAKDRTTCAAYSVRPVPDARVSAPLHWHEVADCQPGDFTVLTMPKRFAEIGDPHAGIEAAPGSLTPLLELAAKDEVSGLGDAPWPPHFRKMEGEARRVAPSRAKANVKKGRTRMPLVVVANSPESRRCSCRSGKVEEQASRGCPPARRGRRAGGFHARQVIDLDPRPGEPPPCARSSSAPGRVSRSRRSNARAASRRDLRSTTTEKVCPGSTAARKNLHQFLRWYYFELCIGAITRRFVFTPSSKLCRMTEARALHMLVGDLHHQLGA